MKQLSRQELMSLEQYSEKRNSFRAEVMAHKKNRHLSLGENLTLYFEDRLTIQYQIQEMLRIEKIFEADGIQEELDAYNPLIPEGKNLKATFMIEYPQVEQRKQMLAQLIGVEDKLWLQVEGFDKVYPIADEDLQRDNAEKTSSVHFLRFEFSAEMIAKLKTGASLAAGVDHENYQQHVAEIPQNIRNSLVNDFD
ncbi:MAG: DUF3501 family protein [Gammaproteobacteria bacterium]|nr:DUF3501 family protein [Gammaproteobacteria bacterium]